MPPSRVLPPLTLEEIGKRDYEEKVLEVKLSNCWAGDKFDEQRAEDLLRAYAIVIFELHLKAFRGHFSFRPVWIPPIVVLSIKRIEECFGRHSWDAEDKYRSVLNETLLSHLCQRHNSLWMEVYRDQSIVATPEIVPVLTGREISAYSLAGIDTKSPGPLVSMALDAAKMTRPKVFTSLQASPRKRISRSIHSDKAARRMEAHIQGKGISQTAFAGMVEVDERTLRRFRSSGKVEKSVAQRIAEAMGISFDDLIS